MDDGYEGLNFRRVDQIFRHLDGRIQIRVVRGQVLDDFIPHRSLAVEFFVEVPLDQSFDEFVQALSVKDIDVLGG